MFGRRPIGALILAVSLLVAASERASAQAKILGSENGLYWVGGMTVDPTGNLFVVGLESHNVFRVPPTGPAEIRVSAFAGLDHPYAIAADPLGNVYVTDGVLVLKLPPEGGNSPVDFGAYPPTRLAADGAGNLFGISSGTVFKRAPGGTITELLDSNGLGGNWLDNAVDVAVAASGDVYAAGWLSHNVFRITSGGAVTEIIDATGDGTNALQYPSDVAVDGSGNVYVAGQFSNNAFKITPGGVITEIIDATGDGLGNTLAGGLGVAVAASGNVYVAGRFNVFSITPGSVITEIIDATGDGVGNGLDANGSAADLVVDSSETVYVAAAQTRNVFAITLGGTITEIIDETGDGLGNTLTTPSGLAVDSTGNAYVSDRGNFTNNADGFKITPGGVITQIIDATGDGMGNSLDRATAIGVAPSGDVFVSSAFPGDVFRVTPGGTISVALAGGAGGGLFFGASALEVAADGTVYLAGGTADSA